MEKVLIIKLGYSETLDNTLNLTTSLGDILRTTFILHYFKGAEVSWLVDRNALPLLQGNSFIKRVLVYNNATMEKLKKEKFDTVVNLEKIPQICRFSNSLDARRYYGFRPGGKCFRYTLSGMKPVNLPIGRTERRRNRRYWQEVLAAALGRKWRKEPYILGYEPEGKIKYDVGFNWTTSNRWLNKAWPVPYWQRLEGLIGEKYSLSWQKGKNNINKYIDWISSCRVIVTADTLGLHLALALNKTVIGLFGPTPHRELYAYGKGLFLFPDAPYKCMPCIKPYCTKKSPCMAYIYPDKVAKAIKRVLKNGRF